MMHTEHRSRSKSGGSSSPETLSYKILMAIPRNLVYVFLCAIIFAFAGMIFVIYTEKDLTSFMDFSQNKEVVVIHPLF